MATPPVDSEESPALLILSYDRSQIERVRLTMPTVLRRGPYRLFFYSGDRIEPPHVHVERGEAEAKLWLDPVRVQRATGFRAAELREIERLVAEHRTQLLEAWHAFFDG